MKKNLWLLLTVSFFMGCASLYNPYEGVDIYYKTKGSGKNRTILITAYFGTSKNVEIPETIKGIPVTEIGREAFSSKGLESVSIPSSVITIEHDAFYNNKLTSVIIPPSVTTIGDEAFRKNNLIASNVKIPAHLNSRRKAIFDESLYNALIASEDPKKVSEVNNMYALANKRRDEGNISAAIYLYRTALVIIPTNEDVQNDLKILWDRRIEQNQRMYPAPFEGEWKFIIKPEELVPQTRSYKNPATGTTEEIYTGRFITKPEQNIVVVFKGKNYIFKATTGHDSSGTFFYHKDNLDMGSDFSFEIKKGFTYIELEKDAFMFFDGDNIYFGTEEDGYLVFERVKK